MALVKDILKDHPAIQHLYVMNQRKVGNKANLDVYATSDNCSNGFSWSRSVEGNDFWSAILMQKKFHVYYDRYGGGTKEVTNSLNTLLDTLKVKTLTVLEPEK